MKANQAGPLIGIMSARKSNGSIAGNGPLYSITKEAYFT